jgi:hypothetical protein
MLTAAFVLLGVAVLLGAGLAVLELRAASAAAPAPLKAAHGLLAVAGFVCLLLALHGPPRGITSGAGSFGGIAAVLLGAAALIGGTILVAHMRKTRRTGLLIGIHATLAVSGFVILAAYVLSG